MRTHRFPSIKTETNVSMDMHYIWIDFHEHRDFTRPFLETIKRSEKSASASLIILFRKPFVNKAKHFVSNPHFHSFINLVLDRFGKIIERGF